MSEPTGVNVDATCGQCGRPVRLTIPLGEVAESKCPCGASLRIVAKVRVGPKVAIWENDGTPAGTWFFAPGHEPPRPLPRASLALFVLSVVTLLVVLARLAYDLWLLLR